MNAIYIPSAGDIVNGSVNLILSAVNSCNSASDFVAVTITPAPEVEAGADLAGCEIIEPFALNGSVVNAGSGVWSSNGSGSFANANALNTTYTPSQQDVNNLGVWLTLTSADNGNCLAVSDSLFLSLSSGIVVNAGADQQVCLQSAFTQLQGSVSNGSTTGTWTTNGTGTFLPDANSINALYQFSANDYLQTDLTFTLTSTNNGACPERSDEMVITFGDAVVVNAGEDATLCSSDESIQLNGVVTAGATAGTWTTTGTGTFSPNADVLNAVYQFSEDDLAAGTVTLTLTSTDQTVCDGNSDEVVFTLPELPTVSAGDEILVCGPIAPVQLLGQYSNAGGVVWTTTGTGTFSPNANTSTATYTPSVADSLAGSIVLTLTTTENGTCPAASDQVNLSFGNLLAANAGPDQAICETTPQVALNGSVAGTSTGVWSSSGAGTFEPSATTLNASYVHAPQDVVLGGVWLVLTTTNNGGCPPQIDSLFLSIDAQPVVAAGSDQVVCSTADEVQLNGEVENAAGGVWSSSGSGIFSPANTDLNAAYLPSAADLNVGSVTLTLTSEANGLCAAESDEVVITITPAPTANAGSDIEVCASETAIALSGSASNQTGVVWTTSGKPVARAASIWA